MKEAYKGLLMWPEKRYLAIGITMPWENNLAMQFGFWREALESGRIARLKEYCGGGEAVGLFCWQCDMAAKTFSYHIACENRHGAEPGPYEALTLKPLTYACFEGDCPEPSEAFAAYERPCGAFWSEWLPDSGCESLIEPDTFACEPGYAAIERYAPEVPLGAYRLEMMFPVRRKT